MILKLKHAHEFLQFKIFRRISQYSVASTDNAAFIIGGYGDTYEIHDTIAEFRDNKWTKYGSLNTGRKQHGSIKAYGETMIIGGQNYSLVQN